MLKTFGSWHDPYPALFEATPAEGVLHHDIHYLASVQADGNVVIYTKWGFSPIWASNTAH